MRICAICRCTGRSLQAAVVRDFGSRENHIKKKMSDWQNGLCGCFNDCSTCIITYFCPCYIFGKSAEAVGDSCCLCGLVYFIGPVNLYARTHIRGKIREQKGINGSCIGDCCTIYFCWACTLCQEAQEIKDIAPQVMLRE